MRLRGGSWSVLPQVTGGTYSDASSADALRETLTKATSRTAVGYQLPQEVVEFAVDKQQAPELVPGTLDKPQRVTAKIPDGESKDIYAKVSIPKGHRLHIGFNVVPEIGAPGAWESDYKVIPSLRTKDDGICHASSRKPAM